ncbi:unnamed protein product [Parnassius apollo]|uniref:(apollo) hypothetical protein n=1 Tax=Parnassius apollo TaxID=110799 RepID=A0A8S3Y8F9_PARAO|nr:unnamed protein product [Parnassius apollo]
MPYYPHFSVQLVESFMLELLIKKTSSSITTSKSSPKPQEVNNKHFIENVQINQCVAVLAKNANSLQEDVQLEQKTKSNIVQVLDTPRKIRLRKKIHEQSKKIKRLQYSNCRLRKRVATLEEILNSLNGKKIL